MTVALIPGQINRADAGHLWLFKTAIALFDEVCLLSEAGAKNDMQSLFPGAKWVSESGLGVGGKPVSHVVGVDAHIIPLAQQLNALPVVLDPGECGPPTLDLSATAFSEVTGERVKRVCIYGPESTGKTVLASYLASTFGTLVMPEYGRTYEQVYAPEPWTTDMLVEIGRTHTAMRDAMMSFCQRLLIEDTDPLLTAVWSDVLCGAVDPWFGDDLPLADLYLVTDIDVPWVADGMRQLGDQDERLKFHRAALSMLEQHGASYVRLSGSWRERNQRAVAAVDQLLSGKS